MVSVVWGRSSAVHGNEIVIGNLLFHVAERRVGQPLSKPATAGPRSASPKAKTRAQIGGIVPIPVRGVHAPLASTNSIHTNHNSPPEFVLSEKWFPRTASDKTTNTRQLHTASKSHTSGSSRRRYRAVLRQASWSQYEASCSAIPPRF